jgi:hypothetical protein
LGQDNTLQNRREFFRLKFSNPVRFKSYTPGNTARSAETGAAVSQNVSQSGILFQTAQTPPQLSSILWMSFDLRTLKICQEIEERALIFNEGVLGRVVRVEEDLKTASTYDVGVCFLTQDQKDSREVQQILSQISQR